MSELTPLFVANWKMNHLRAEAERFCVRFLNGFSTTESGETDVGIAPPFLALETVANALAPQHGIIVGSQNVHWEASGAQTGEVSVAMLQDVGAQFAIVGHSERRQYFGETNASVSKRASAAIDGGLTAIVCIGETQQEFEAGQTTAVVQKQLSESLAGIPAAGLDKLVLAYEPVWAIGTGLAATPDIAEEVHTKIRSDLLELYGEPAEAVKILYGGSTKPDNIASLISRPNVNGALVGGASLEAETFWELIVNGRAAA